MLRLAFRRSLLCGSRTYSHGSLHELLPGVPQHPDAVTGESASPTLSTLDNGVRVVSIDQKLPVVGLRVFVDAGPRRESYHNAGISFFFSQMALKVDALSVDFSHTVTRDAIEYSAKAMRQDAEDMLELMGDMLAPKAPEWEVKQTAALASQRAGKACANSSVVAFENLYSEAYRHEGIGRPLFPSTSFGFSVDDVRHFAAEQVTRENVVVLARGMAHDELERAAATAFAHLGSGAAAPRGTAERYFGGEKRVEVCGVPTVAFLAHDAHGQSAATTGLLAALLGDVSPDTHAVSSRGLLREHCGDGLQSGVAAAFGFATRHDGAALLGVHIEAMPGAAGDAVASVRATLAQLASKPVSDEQLAAAKKRFSVGVLSDSQYEDDLSSLLGGATPVAVVSEAQKLTAQDISKAAKAILGTKETLSVIGEVSGILQQK